MDEQIAVRDDEREQRGEDLRLHGVLNREWHDTERAEEQRKAHIRKLDFVSSA